MHEGGGSAFGDVTQSADRSFARAARTAAGAIASTTRTCSPTQSDADLFTPFFLARALRGRTRVARRSRQRRHTTSYPGRSGGSTTRRLPPGRRCSRTAARAKSTTTSGSPRAALPAGRRRRCGPYRRSFSPALGILSEDESGPARGGPFDPNRLDELAYDPRAVRPQPPGQQAAEPHVRRVGPGPHRRPGPLPPVRRPADDARRAAHASRRARRSSGTSACSSRRRSSPARS